KVERGGLPDGELRVGRLDGGGAVDVAGLFGAVVAQVGTQAPGGGVVLHPQADLLGVDGVQWCAGGTVHALGAAPAKGGADAPARDGAPVVDPFDLDAGDAGPLGIEGLENAGVGGCASAADEHGVHDEVGVLVGEDGRI